MSKAAILKELKTSLELTKGVGNLLSGIAELYDKPSEVSAYVESACTILDSLHFSINRLREANNEEEVA